MKPIDESILAILGNPEDDLIQLKSSDIQGVRTEMAKLQNGKCPICGNDLRESEMTLDHQHKFKKTDENGEGGNGLIRGCLCRNCNAFEGKVFNGLSRFLGIRTTEERIKALQNIIKYYESGCYPMIHPTEAKKEKQISKRQFNRLQKAYKEAFLEEQKTRKNPKEFKQLEFPKTGKLTKNLRELFEKFEISPFN